MKVDSYPYNFATFFDNDTNLCFLRSEDTVKDLIVSCLQLILGDKYSYSKDYNAYIIFQGVKITQLTVIINSFKTKKYNNVVFAMRKTLKKVQIYLSRI